MSLPEDVIKGNFEITQLVRLQCHTQHYAFDLVILAL